MTEKNKKEKKTCKYHNCLRDCWRDDEYCIFHSEDNGKKKDFNYIFWKEFKRQKEEEKRYNFSGFVFPNKISFGKREFEKDVSFYGAKFLVTTFFSKFYGNVDFREAHLYKANFLGTLFHKRASFNHAQFYEEVHFVGSIFVGKGLHDGAYFEEAKFPKKTYFNETKFLKGPIFKKTNLKGANFYKSHLQEADFSFANLKGADLRGTSFEKAIVENVKYDRSTKFKGIDVTQATGSPLFIRFAKDQEFLEGMQSTIWGKVKYSIWNVLADCGRTMWRWTFWCFFVAFYFAVNFNLIYYVNFQAFSFNPSIESTNFGSFLYYSIVTFTTLGFGDIIPTANYVQRWVIAEVIMGYVMLGFLIGIGINKFARRS